MKINTPYPTQRTYVGKLWYKHEDVKLTKGHWTNRSNKVISKKSFWRRAK